MHQKSNNLKKEEPSEDQDKIKDEDFIRDKFKKPKNKPYKRVRGNIDWQDKAYDNDYQE